MRRFSNRTGLLTALLVSLSMFTGAPRALAADPPPTTYEVPSRIVVVSDILGEFGLFVDVLRIAKLIDDDNEWIGGEAHLVILGNIVGFGQGVLPSFDLIMELESEAERAGGMVHLLLGYGEIQLLHRDAGIVDPANYAHLATDDSNKKIDEFTERGVQEVLSRFPGAPYPDRLRAEYERMMDMEMKPGGVEFLELFEPGTKYGDWLRSRNVIIRIGDLIYSHGGLSPKFVEIPLQQINDETRADLAKDTLLLQKDIDIAHPSWWRDMTAKTETEMQRVVEEVLAEAQARALVVGINQPRLATRDGLGGRAFFVDSGMRSHQNREADRRLSSLEIVGEKYTLLWDDTRVNATTPPPNPPKKR